MQYTIHLIIKSELDEVIFESSTSSIADLEENLIRKAEHSIKDYEYETEIKAQAEIDRQQEQGE